MLVTAAAATIGMLLGWGSWVVGRRIAAGQVETLADAWMRRALPVVCVALGGGAMALAASRSGGDAVVLVRVGLLGAPLLTTLATDLLARLVYPLVLLPGWLLALGLAATGPGGVTGSLVASAVAGGAAALLALLAGRLWPDAAETPLGEGEIFIAAAAGAMLGPERTLPALFAGMVLGAVVAGLLLATRRREGEDVLPYGAFLCLATLMALAL